VKARDGMRRSRGVGDEMDDACDDVVSRIDALLERWSSDPPKGVLRRTDARAELKAIARAAAGRALLEPAVTAAIGIVEALPGDEALAGRVGDGPVEARPRTHWRWLLVATLARLRNVADEDRAGREARPPQGPYRGAPARVDENVELERMDGHGAEERIRCALDREMSRKEAGATEGTRADRFDELRAALEEMALAASPHAALEAAMANLTGAIVTMRGSAVRFAPATRRNDCAAALDRVEGVHARVVGVSGSRDDLIAAVVARLDAGAPPSPEPSPEANVVGAIAAALASTRFRKVVRSLKRLDRAADAAQAASTAASAALGWSDRLNVLWESTEKRRAREASEAAAAAEDTHRESVDAMYALFAGALEGMPGIALHLELPRVRRAVEDIREIELGGIDGHDRLVEAASDWCRRAEDLHGRLPSAADVLLRYVVARFVPPPFREGRRDHTS
jgi:hypothetical protein